MVNNYFKYIKLTYKGQNNMGIIKIADKPTLDNVNTKVGATGDSGASSSAGTLFGKLNKIISDITSFVGNWTATRAGYIDNIRSYTITDNTASKTGVLSAKLSYIISLLENTTYGLSAIATKLSSIGGTYELKYVSGTLPTGNATSATILSASGRQGVIDYIYVKHCFSNSDPTVIKIVADGIDLGTFTSSSSGSGYASVSLPCTINFYKSISITCSSSYTVINQNDRIAGYKMLYRIK